MSNQCSAFVRNTGPSVAATSSTTSCLYFPLTVVLPCVSVMATTVAVVSMSLCPNIGRSYVRGGGRATLRFRAESAERLDHLGPRDGVAFEPLEELAQVERRLRPEAFEDDRRADIGRRLE